jgi:hypothetical protein
MARTLTGVLIRYIEAERRIVRMYNGLTRAEMDGRDRGYVP